MLGILTYDDILAELKQGKLITHGIESNVEACSYDLRVGTIFKEGQIITGEQGQVILQPGDIVSLFTLEELDLPADIAATAFAMNAMSSQGILVLNPGHVDPGYKGPLTVRVINLRATPKSIDLKTNIFTVVFERLPKVTSKPYPPIKDDRVGRERKFNSSDVEQNPHSMARLVMLGKDRPLMTGDEVDRRIREHWTTALIFVATLVAAVFAVVAVLRSESARPTQTNSPPLIQMATPSPPIGTTGQDSNSDQTQRNENVKKPTPR
jgi:deoxycytidine triphosphate deaminase